MNTFKWIGHEKTYLDEIHVEKCGPLSIGLYGGNQDVGADTEKREDAVLAWCDPQLDFEFVMIFDAHHKAKNIHFIIEEICERKEKLQELFAYPVNLAFHHTHMYLLALFTDEAFIEKCEQGKVKQLVSFAYGKVNFYIGYQSENALPICFNLNNCRMEKVD